MPDKNNFIEQKFKNTKFEICSSGNGGSMCTLMGGCILQPTDVAQFLFVDPRQCSWLVLLVAITEIYYFFPHLI